MVAFGPSTAQAAQAIELSLAQCVALAIENNRSLINARLGRDVSRFALVVAEDEFRPDISLGAAVAYRGGSYFDGSADGSLSPSLTIRLPTGGRISATLDSAFEDVPNGESYATSVRLTQPLLRGGGTEVGMANLRNSRRREEMSILTFQSTVMGIVDSAVTTYRSLVLAQRQAQIAERALARSQDQLEINRLLIQTGRMASRDAVQTEAEIANRELSLTRSKNSLDRSRLRLVDILEFDSDTAVTATDVLEVMAVEPELNESLETAFRRRTDYRRALLGLEITRTGLRIANNGRLWGLDLSASASSNGARGFPDGDSLSESNSYNVGLTLSVPVYGDYTRRQQLLSAQTALAQAEHNLDELRQDIDIEVRNAVRDVDAQLTQVTLAERARQLAEEALDIEREKLNLGLSTNFRVARFEDSLISAQNSEVSTIVNYLNTLTSLDRTLGTTLDRWNIEIEQASQ